MTTVLAKFRRRGSGATFLIGALACEAIDVVKLV